MWAVARLTEIFNGELRHSFVPLLSPGVNYQETLHIYQHVNLKIFCVACRHSIRKICRQNQRGCWHRILQTKCILNVMTFICWRPLSYLSFVIHFLFLFFGVFFASFLVLGSACYPSWRKQDYRHDLLKMIADCSHLFPEILGICIRVHPQVPVENIKEI